jgi:uncharacterized membrane protein YfbV (UPF0208 family)
MPEKPRYIIRKWVEKTFTGQLDSIERRVLEAIFMNIKSLRAVKYVTLNTTDMFKAGLQITPTVLAALFCCRKTLTASAM